MPSLNDPDNVAGRKGDNIPRGIALIVTGLMIVPSIDAIAKHLAGSVSALQITWARFLFQSMLMGVLVIALHGSRSLWPSRPFIHLLRGILLAIATMIFFASLKYLPLADAIAIFFVQPLILTLISGWFLGEQVGWPRRIAVCVGFLGALIIIQPGGQNFTPAAVMPLATAVCFAIYMALTRYVAGHDKAETAQFAAGAGAFIVLSLIITAGVLTDTAALKMISLTVTQWGWLLLLGVIAALCHLLVVKATELAPASVLAPFGYTEFIGSATLGWLFFNEIPSLNTWVGASVIVASGLYVFFREARAHQANSGPS